MDEASRKKKLQLNGTRMNTIVEHDIKATKFTVSFANNVVCWYFK